MSNWILFGFKGSGKTYFGFRLAQKKALPFIDTDQLIEEKMKISCREIVLQFGEPYFRKLESQIVQSLCSSNTIISLGGGTVMFSENLHHLKKLGSFIYLKCSKEMLKNHMLIPPFPSYIDPQFPKSSFEKIYLTYTKQYETIPSYQITMENKSQQQILEELWHLTNLEISSESQPGENPMEKQLE